MDAPGSTLSISSSPDDANTRTMHRNADVRFVEVIFHFIVDACILEFPCDDANSEF